MDLFALEQQEMQDGPNSAKRPEQSGQRGRAVGLDQAPPQAPSPRPEKFELMRKKHHSNPHAKMLAEIYVPKIMSMIQAGLEKRAATDKKTAQPVTPRNPALVEFRAILEGAWEKYQADEAQRRALAEFPL